jgi:hypothetical protein
VNSNSTFQHCRVSSHNRVDVKHNLKSFDLLKNKNMKCKRYSWSPGIGRTARSFENTFSQWVRWVFDINRARSFLLTRPRIVEHEGHRLNSPLDKSFFRLPPSQTGGTVGTFPNSTLNPLAYLALFSNSETDSPQSWRLNLWRSKEIGRLDHGFGKSFLESRIHLN